MEITNGHFAQAMTQAVGGQFQNKILSMFG